MKSKVYKHNWSETDLTTDWMTINMCSFTVADGFVFNQSNLPRGGFEHATS